MLRLYVLLLLLLSFLRAIGIVVICQLSVFPYVLDDVWALKELVRYAFDIAPFSIISGIVLGLVNWLELWNDEGVIAHLISESLLGLVCRPNLFKQTLRLFLGG